MANGGQLRPLGSLLMIVLRCLAFPSVALPAQLESIDFDETSQQYNMFEVRFQLTETYPNPFDPDEIDIWAYFRSPSGNTEKRPAFWYQHYNSEGMPDMKPEWRIRYSPKEAGRYYVHMAGDDRRAKIKTRYPSGGATHQFSVSPAASPGFVKKCGKDSRYFCFENGATFFGVGSGPILNGDVIRNHSKFRMNWIQTEFAPAFMIEDHTVGRYNLFRAFQGDEFLHEAEKNGVYFQIVFSHWSSRKADMHTLPDEFQQYEGNLFPPWPENPYNSKNGGPLSHPSELFSNGEARRHYKNLIRYYVARWGYTTNVLSWAFWGEFDMTRPAAGEPYLYETVERWHSEMAGYVKRLDPHHLVTTCEAEPSKSYGRWISVTPEWKKYQVRFFSEIGDANTRLQFEMGREAGRYWLSGISLSHQSELIRNPDFNEGLTHWSFRGEWEGSKANATLTEDSPKKGVKSVRIDVVRPSPINWHVGIMQDNLPTEQGKEYILTFWAKSAAPRRIEVSLIQAHEPWQRTGVVSNDGIWRLDAIDYVTMHHYSPQIDEDIASRLSHYQQTGKPVVIQEFGVWFDPFKDDEIGKIAYHNAIWRLALRGAAGAPMKFTRVVMDREYAAVSNFMGDIDAARGRIRPIDFIDLTPTAKGGGSPVEISGLSDGQRTYIWVHDRQHTYRNVHDHRYHPREISDAKLILNNIDGMDFRVEYWDTRRGVMEGSQMMKTDKSSLVLSIPPFIRDMGIKLRRVK